MMPDSVVIVRWPQGWVAHVRYQNPELDQDISAPTKYTLYWKVEKLVEEQK